MVFRYSSLDGATEKPLNNFKNDGSFLETFKKLQSSKAMQQKRAEESASSSSSSSSTSSSSSSTSEPTQSNNNPGPSTAPRPPKPVPPVIGKRRGGRVLPTGKVKKIKTDEEVEETPKDAWSQYLREVKKYRETTCQEEDNKTRPLVK